MGIRLAVRHYLEVSNTLVPGEGAELSGSLLLRVWGATVRWEDDNVVVAPRVEVEGLVLQKV